MRRYLSLDRRIGRLWISCAPWALNLPRLHVNADGDAVNVALSYGNGNSDPVLSLDLDLSGTRTGRAVAAAYWWHYDRRHPRHLTSVERAV